jgi:hypothetical protein
MARMLSLPGGINRSVTAHNSKRDIFYDWLEADVLFLDDDLSETDVVDFLMEEQIYTDQNLCSEYVSGAWTQLRRRLGWMGTSSPISFQDRVMIRRNEWREVPALSFCLVLSLGVQYTDWSSSFSSDYTEQGSLFESLTLQAIAKIYSGWEFIRTGWSRDFTSNIRDVVPKLAEQLGEETGDLERWASGKVHEAGLDLVWYKPFTDDRGGLPVYLAQCASGKNWYTKLHTPELSVWKKLIDFTSEPYKAFSLPFALADDEFTRRCNQMSGLLLDRYRLLVCCVPEGEWVPVELHSSLTQWLEPRVDWLLAR